ncbi:MAG: methylmalonyl-CoA mutase, partial [Candidatus Marinimicrobia bacterium]|nr:methylmalonyl-CoA mutase [Candidatus Neomarinimicrobiota bacterium]
EEAMNIIEEIDEMGGSITAIETGWIQSEITKSAYEYQKSVENKKIKIVGVNKLTDENENETNQNTQQINESLIKNQIDRVKHIKVERDNSSVKLKLDRLLKVAKSDDNVMPAIVEAVRAECTLGEIADVFRTCFGEFK